MESDGTQGIERKVMSALTQAYQAGMLADKASLRRCKSWLMRSAKGSKVDLRTNATKNRPYELVIADFDRIYQGSLSAIPEALRDVFMDELEESNRSKVGPKSMYQSFYADGPKKLAAVYSNKPTPKDLDRKALARARDRIVSEIPAGTILCRGVEETLATERSPSDEHSIDAAGLDPTTNSGAPFFKSGFKPHDGMTPFERDYTQMMYDYILRRAKAAYSDLRSGNIVPFDVMVGQRIVNRGLHPFEDEKTKRLVMAFEKAEAVLWKTFMPQIQNRLKEVKSASGVHVHVAWMDAPRIDEACQKHLEYCALKGYKSLSGDISGFDQSVIPDIWNYLAQGMSSWFKHEGRFFRTLNRSVNSHSRVLSPLGVMIPGPGSMPSGSGGTNFIGGSYNKLALYYGEELGLYKAESNTVQGDDFFTAGYGVEPEVISLAYSHLGLTVHPDKGGFASDYVSYLQRLHFKGRKGGVASAWRVLASCLVYEKLAYSAEEWNPYLEAIQLVSKLENAAFHPMFDKLVGYVASLDKYHLFKDVSARTVLNKAGGLSRDLLARDTAASISTRTMDADGDGFSKSATNGVLRGEVLPPWGSEARFHRVYGDRRINGQ